MREEFKAAFGLPANGFLNPTDLQDVRVGFSTEKFQRPPDFFSLFKVYIDNKEITSANSLKEVKVRISFGKKIDNQIVISSREWKRKINWPADLVTDREFFYDIETKKFFDKKSREIEAKNILERVNAIHLKPTHFFRGLPIRTKLFFWHSFLAKILLFTSDFLASLLLLISGIRVGENVWARTEEVDKLTPSYSQKQSELSGRKMKLFGYEASAWSIVVYCIIHVLLYYLFQSRGLKPEFFTNIVTNNFLTLVYVISSLWFFEWVLPRFLKYLIRRFSRWFIAASFKEINI